MTSKRTLCSVVVRLRQFALFRLRSTMIVFQEVGLVLFILLSASLKSIIGHDHHPCACQKEQSRKDNGDKIFGLPVGARNIVSSGMHFNISNVNVVNGTLLGTRHYVTECCGHHFGVCCEFHALVDIFVSSIILAQKVSLRIIVTVIVFSLVIIIVVPLSVTLVVVPVVAVLFLPVSVIGGRFVVNGVGLAGLTLLVDFHSRVPLVNVRDQTGHVHFFLVPIVVRVTIVGIIVVLCLDVGFVVFNDRGQAGLALVINGATFIRVETQSHIGILQRLDIKVQHGSVSFFISRHGATARPVLTHVLHKLIFFFFPQADTLMLEQLFVELSKVGLLEETQEVKVFGILQVAIHLGATFRSRDFAGCGVPFIIVGVVVLVLTDTATFVVDINVRRPQQVSKTGTIVTAFPRVGMTQFTFHSQVSSILVALFNLVAINVVSQQTPRLGTFGPKCFTSIQKVITVMRIGRSGIGSIVRIVIVFFTIFVVKVIIIAVSSFGITALVVIAIFFDGRIITLFGSSCIVSFFGSGRIISFCRRGIISYSSVIAYGGIISYGGSSVVSGGRIIGPSTILCFLLSFEFVLTSIFLHVLNQFGIVFGGHEMGSIFQWHPLLILGQILAGVELLIGQRRY
mmetsp:Transcript_7681/g.21371  ORF Transcript_7681/g.21371 Transcript_7681/m.21371 type:complete len:626 (-) Transcript_7681:171-2048(-)